ncbi:unnamed protein product [Acanthoscelides obtectus]|uniref:Uncharacterized protein n=1 Tax=Acanthoscelides obtectus TaxID=200917 RepID=A0A9P0L718_ACAOB|nr:unnamed protein product [Acanthoscelides obtectus]CAK1649722.1 hypothetical protein AOBTE_LOCUS16379 [Acanthoscelides obtectus]
MYDPVNGGVTSTESGQGSGSSFYTDNPLSASTSQWYPSGPYPEPTCSRCSRPFYFTDIMMERYCNTLYLQT